MSMSRLGVAGGPINRRTKSDIGTHRPKVQYLRYRRNALHPSGSSLGASGSDLDAANELPSNFQLRRLSSAPGLSCSRRDVDVGKNRLRSIRQLADITASSTNQSKSTKTPASVVDKVVEEESEETENSERSIPDVNISEMEASPTIVLNDAEEAVTAENDVMDVTQDEECRKVSFEFNTEDTASNRSLVAAPPSGNSNDNNSDSNGSNDNKHLLLQNSREENRRRSTSTYLTMEQRQAFREVFDLFDRTGGGTFDADELDEALRTVNICLDKSEIVEVIYGLDKDGNGEIDFEEFLSLMTNTERFLESLVEHHNISDSDHQLIEERKQRKERESLLFKALTQFMKKSAIIGIGEIVGYYHTKYTKAPHVVQHYAAGARLIGLTEKQLHMRLEDLRASSKDHDSGSPYAQPLNYKFWWPTLEKKKKKKKERTHRRIHLVKFSKDHDHNQLVNGQSRKELAKTKSLSDRRRGKVGWQSPRIRHTELKLPMMELVKQQEDKLKRDQNLTFDDLPLLRKNVTSATKSYYNRLWYARTKESKRHWEILDTNSIHSKLLRNQYSKTYKIYSSPEHPRMTTGISAHHMATTKKRGDNRAWDEDKENVKRDKRASSIIPSLLGPFSATPTGGDGSDPRRQSIATPGVRRQSTGASGIRRLSVGAVGNRRPSVGTSGNRRPSSDMSGNRRPSSDMSGGRRLSGTKPSTRLGDMGLASTDRKPSALVLKETGGILPTLAEDSGR